jgi:hypothetical protein
LFLFHADRIDQIAAATAVASTDRSKSRWKNKTNEQTEEEALQGEPSTPINKPYDLTITYTTLARHT